MTTLTQQLIYFFASILLALSFWMLIQSRQLRLIYLLALQALILSIDMTLVGYATMQTDLYITALLTLVLKVGVIPVVLIYWLKKLPDDIALEPIVNLPSTLLIALLLTIFAFHLSLPIAQFSHNPVQPTLGLALASVLIASFMMIIKRNVISRLVGFLALENSLFFVAGSSAYAMPLMVELGIALDVLVAIFIMGIFFFRIE